MQDFTKPGSMDDPQVLYLDSEQQNPTFDEPSTSGAGLATFEGQFNVLIPPRC
jgi:hypothetical protein